MAKRAGAGRSRFSATPDGAVQALGFFASVDATAEKVGQWDIKTEVMVAAVLGLVGSGRSIAFYTAWHGESVNIRIYEGDAKDDKGARDSVEFDTLMQAIVDKLRAEGTLPAR